MRSMYDFMSLLRGLDAWEGHKTAWLASMNNAKQSPPTPEMVKNYRNCWLEGWLENDAERNQTAEG